MSGKQKWTDLAKKTDLTPLENRIGELEKKVDKLGKKSTPGKKAPVKK